MNIAGASDSTVANINDMFLVVVSDLEKNTQSTDIVVIEDSFWPSIDYNYMMAEQQNPCAYFLKSFITFATTKHQQSAPDAHKWVTRIDRDLSV